MTLECSCDKNAKLLNILSDILCLQLYMMQVVSIPGWHLIQPHSDLTLPMQPPVLSALLCPPVPSKEVKQLQRPDKKCFLIKLVATKAYTNPH